MTDLQHPADRRERARAELRPLERALAELMSDISEECWCAGWMRGTEDAIWEMIHGRRTEWGQGAASGPELRAISALSEMTQVWIIWGDDGWETVPLPEWREAKGDEPQEPLDVEDELVMLIQEIGDVHLRVQTETTARDWVDRLDRILKAVNRDA